MTTWVSYGKFHGWVHWGTRSSALLSGEDSWSKTLRVVCAAEGGKVDMVQCYDAGIMTVGPLGATARFGYVQRLMGKLIEHDVQRFLGYFNDVLFNESEAMVLPASKSNTGYALYLWDTPYAPVLDEPTLRHIFLAGSDGVTWSAKQKDRAWKWVNSFVSATQDSHFLPTITAESVWLLRQFATQAAMKVIEQVPREGRERMRAAFLAFAVNHPTGAMRLLKSAVAAPDPVARILELARQRAHQTPKTFQDRVGAVERALAAEFP